MAKILVRTPITSNGRDLVLDENMRVRYKETILEDFARPIIEKQNLKKPTPLKKIITPYEPVKKVTAVKYEVQETSEPVVFQAEASWDVPDEKPVEVKKTKTAKRGTKSKS